MFFQVLFICLFKEHFLVCKDVQWLLLFLSLLFTYFSCKGWVKIPLAYNFECLILLTKVSTQALRFEILISRENRHDSLKYLSVWLFFPQVLKKLINAFDRFKQITNFYFTFLSKLLTLTNQVHLTSFKCLHLVLRLIHFPTLFPIHNASYSCTLVPLKKQFN